MKENNSERIFLLNWNNRKILQFDCAKISVFRPIIYIFMSIYFRQWEFEYLHWKMFWKYNSQSTSQIDALLDKADVGLTEVLEQEDIIQECKNQNRKLVD